MRRQFERPSTYEEFLRTALELRCNARSALERPRLAEAVRVYRTDVADLLAEETYPVRFVDERNGKLVESNHPSGSPVTIRELVANSQHVRALLGNWSGNGGDWDRGLPYLALHCAGCEKLVLLDGLHRVAWLASKEETGQALLVVELSGHRWRREAPEIGAICSCR
jgi:hypothetical protein